MKKAEKKSSYILHIEDLIPLCCKEWLIDEKEEIMKYTNCSFFVHDGRRILAKDNRKYDMTITGSRESIRKAKNYIVDYISPPLRHIEIKDLMAKRPKEVGVCYDLLNQGCNDANCYFDHPPSSELPYIVCKDFLFSDCRRSHCRLPHRYPPCRRYADYGKCNRPGCKYIHSDNNDRASPPKFSEVDDSICATCEDNDSESALSESSSEMERKQVQFSEVKIGHKRKPSSFSSSNSSSESSSESLSSSYFIDESDDLKKLKHMKLAIMIREAKLIKKMRDNSEKAQLEQN